MQFKIKKVKYPGPSKSQAGRKPVYPFEKLGVDDAFHVPSKAENISDVRSLTAAIYRARHKHDMNIHWSKDREGFWIHRLKGKYDKNAKA